jgi:hypothetical protein
MTREQAQIRLFRILMEQGYVSRLTVLAIADEGRTMAKLK